MNENPSNITAYIALGANLGDPISQLKAAFLNLASLPHTRLEKTSSFYRSAAFGVIDEQPDYVNAVGKIQTSLSAQNLLDALLKVEADFGRIRKNAHKEARPLDLDILLYGKLSIQTKTLEIPHPRLHERAFVLLPLLEITPDLHIPQKGRAECYLPFVASQAIIRLSPQMSSHEVIDPAMNN